MTQTFPSLFNEKGSEKHCGIPSSMRLPGRTKPRVRPAGKALHHPTLRAPLQRRGILLDAGSRSSEHPLTRINCIKDSDTHNGRTGTLCPCTKLKSSYPLPANPPKPLNCHLIAGTIEATADERLGEGRGGEPLRWNMETNSAAG